MKIKPRLRFIGCLFAPLCLFSQSMPPPANTPGATEDETVYLDVFTVESGPEVGYAPGDSITGTRANTKIRDLPFQVEVMTSEFLEDFAIFDLNEEAGYISGLSDMEAGNGGFNVRGFASVRSLRNGFNRIGLFDRTAVDRIEVIKGPSAALYGETRPGGLLNVITKRPKKKPTYKLSAQAGSYETVRGDVEATGPISGVKNTYYLVAAGGQERAYDNEYLYMRQQTAVLSVLHEFGKRTHLLVEGEYIRRDTNQPERVPYAYDATNPATQRYTRLAVEEAKYFSGRGPAAFIDRWLYGLNTTFSHSFSKDWTVRVAGNYYDRTYKTFNPGTGEYNVNTGLTLDRRPSTSYIAEDGGGVQADTVKTYWLFGRTIECRTLLTLDYTLLFRYSAPTNMSDAVRTQYVAEGKYYKNLSFTNPNYAVPLPGTPGAYRPTEKNDNRTDVYGAFLRHQMALFRGRMIVALGMRYDRMDLDLDWTATEGASHNHKKENYSNWTPNAGVNFKILPEIAAYFNYSEAFYTDSQNKTGDPSDDISPESGFGYDYGFKVGLFEDKLNFTLGGYYSRRENFRITDIDDEFNTVRLPSGSGEAMGWEFAGNWRPNRKFTLLSAYSYTSAKYTNRGNDLDAVGRAGDRIPSHLASLVLKYQFRSGVLNGLSCTFGARYTGAAFLQPTTGGIRDADGYIRSNDGRREIKTPANTVVTLGATYSWRTRPLKLGHRVGVTIKNLFDEDYLTTRGVPGDGRGIYGSYQVQF